MRHLVTGLANFLANFIHRPTVVLNSAEVPNSHDTQSHAFPRTNSFTTIQNHSK